MSPLSTLFIGFPVAMMSGDTFFSNDRFRCNKGMPAAIIGWPAHPLRSFIIAHHL